MNRLFKKEQNSHKSESIERYKAYAAVFSDIKYLKIV